MSRKYQYLYGGETRPGWRWDGNLWTWMEVRQYIEVVKTESWDLDPVEEGHGWRWDTHLETCMGLRWCLDGTKMQFGGPGWGWDVNIRTQIEVRFNWDKEETWIWEPGWRGDTNLETCIGLRWDLDWVEMHILRRGWGDMGLGWSWDTILQLTKGLDGGETHILKHVCIWDDAWMELRCNLVDLDGGEM